VKLLWPFFLRFLRHRRQLIAGFLCIPLAQLGDIAITIVIGNALDALRQGSDTDFLSGVFAIVLGLSLFKGVFRYLQPDGIGRDAQPRRIKDVWNAA